MTRGVSAYQALVREKDAELEEQIVEMERLGAQRRDLVDEVEVRFTV